MCASITNCVSAILCMVIILQSYFGKKEARFAQLKQFEPIQSQEELHIIPGSNATTTVNGIDIASYRNKERNKVIYVV